jgi:asparagine synthase (glutamine-hydrolysing)
MCGINGVFRTGNNKVQYSRQVESMNIALQHRGPDDSGVYSDKNISLGHQRLAIIDLSSDGHQPFLSVDQNFVIVYNGELYNYQDIKSQIKDYPFQTNTDTEVILAAYISLGADCLKLFNGMFSFAIWNKEKKELFIARDRVGIKPLYYSIQDTCIVFSSEIRALLASEEVPRKLNKLALPEYLQYQTVHAPNTIIEDVSVLLPGSYARVIGNKITIEKYWDPTKHINPSVLSHSKKEVVDNVAKLLTESVERRMISDVPFGAFLSGGIDSSLIVGLMNKITTKPVNTFSITFDDQKFSEAKYSNIVAKHFKTNHNEIQLKVKNFIDELPNALESMDHPSGDGPNSYLVSKATKTAGITVALSGLGGDELFAGYSIFKQASDVNSKSYLNNIPVNFRKLFAQLYARTARGVSGEKISEVLSLPKIATKYLYPTYRKALLNRQVNDLTGPNSAERINLLGQFTPLNRNVYLPLLSEVSVYELSTYMQNTLLRDTDQMSMASALEVRVPFLDHQLVEYVLSVSDEIKYPLTPKSLLIDSFKGLVPNEVIYRKKMGFVLPWTKWLKNELREFCVDRMESIEKRGIFEGGVVIQLWNSFLKNDPKVSWSRVWHIVVLEDWLQRNNIEA